MRQIKQNIVHKLIAWRNTAITDRQFILLLSAVIGVLTGIGALIIKFLVHSIQTFLDGFAEDTYKSLYIVFPFVGILIVVIFIKYINKRPVRHGIPSVLYAISKANGFIRRHNIYSSVITSSLTVGFGGSVGLEGPTVATGAAIGSNLGKALNLNYKQITLLLGCACAGAMSAIFKAPIAAIVFALEVIMLDLTMAAIVPLLISSATAALTSYFLMGQNVLYPVKILDEFQINNVPYYLLLGVFTSLVSLYFTKTYLWITEWFEKIIGDFKRLLIGGISLGVLIFLLPFLYGEGYQIINKALAGDYSYLFEYPLYAALSEYRVGILLMFLLLIVFKAIATSLTFGSGGVGGIFAPSLYLGANSGLFFALVLNSFGLGLPVTSFALAGMAGLISGIIHAPLTAIFLIAELTGGYELFMPLMLVATTSYAITRLFSNNSVYTIQLAKRGELITHHKDKALLLRMKIDDLIEKDFNAVNPNMTLGGLVKVITHAHRNIFPVVEEDGTFRGIVKMDDIRHIMFNQSLYEKFYVRDLMFMPLHVIERGEPMEEIARKFHESNRYNIAVIEKGKYLGFVSRAKMFSSYRQLLKDISEH